jgi:membrane protein
MPLKNSAALARRSSRSLVDALNRFVDAEAYRLAASLSFYALSSMLPLLLLVVGVGDLLLGSSDQLRQELVRSLNVTDSAVLRSLILSALEPAANTEERSSWSIAIGLAGALFGASSIFLELDAAMEKLFLVAGLKRSVWENTKRYLFGRSAAFALVSALCLLLLFGVVILSSVEFLVERLGLSSAALPGGLTSLGTIVFTGVALTLCYSIVPEPKVKLRAALSGGILAGALLAIVKFPLSWALMNMTGYAAYGAIGAVLVLVSWFYVASIIVLLGAALTAVLNTAPDAVPEAVHTESSRLPT